LIGVNGFIFKPFSKLSDDEWIIDCCCFSFSDTDIHNKMRVSEIICKKAGERVGFSVALLESPQIDITYHGLTASAVNHSVQNELSNISFKYDDHLPPSITTGDQRLYMEIKKCLSMLSDFQIISLSIIMPKMLEKI
jgi:hypothetical protein